MLIVVVVYRVVKCRDFSPNVAIFYCPSHINHVVLVICLHEWWALQFKVDTIRLLEKLFITIFVFSQSFWQKSTQMKPTIFFLFLCIEHIWHRDGTWNLCLKTTATKHSFLISTQKSPTKASSHKINCNCQLSNKLRKS